MTIVNTELLLHDPQKILRGEKEPLILLIFLLEKDFSLTTPMPTETAPPHSRSTQRLHLPGKGMPTKLLVSTCRRVSKCCCKTVFRLRSWITSTSSFSTAVRMLSTCFCRAAFLSSNSMLDLRSWRSSASRAVNSPTRHTQNTCSTRSLWGVPMTPARKFCSAVSNYLAHLTSLFSLWPPR